VILLGGGKVVLSRRQSSRTTKVKTAVVTKKDLRETVSLDGHLEAHEKVTLKFKTGGLLTWVGVKEGDWVKKYQAIASLDKRELKKRLKKEMNDYLKARLDWEQKRDDYQYWQRWFELSDEEKRILAEYQYNLDSAVADVEIADLAVRLATITTPIEGIVTRVEAPFPGVNISPSEAEFEVVNPQTIYFYAEADEEDVVKIQKGMKATISLDAFPGETFSGEVGRVDFAPTSGSGGPSYPVRIEFLHLDNKEMKFKLGMEGEATVEIAQEKNVLTIPLEALHGEENLWVWVMTERGKEKREVKTGISSEEAVEVLSGLQEGEKVLLYFIFWVF